MAERESSGPPIRHQSHRRGSTSLTLFKPHCFPKALPTNTLTLGIRNSMYELRVGYTNIQPHWRPLHGLIFYLFIYGCFGSYLQRADSFVVVMGSVVAVWGLSCPVACGIFVPQPGVEPTCPALQRGFLTTEQLGKSLHGEVFKWHRYQQGSSEALNTLLKVRYQTPSKPLISFPVLPALSTSALFHNEYLWFPKYFCSCHYLCLHSAPGL